MKTYLVEGMITVSVYTKVEAESKDEAERIAGDREDISKSEWGDDNLSNYSWVNEDFDGEVTDIRAEEE